VIVPARYELKGQEQPEGVLKRWFAPAEAVVSVVGIEDQQEQGKEGTQAARSRQYYQQL